MEKLDYLYRFWPSQMLLFTGQRQNVFILICLSFWDLLPMHLHATFKVPWEVSTQEVDSVEPYQCWVQQLSFSKKHEILSLCEAVSLSYLSVHHINLCGK